jgi:hypothetical protein
MIFGGLEIVAAAAAAKLLAAHGGHAVAAQWALAAQHPLPVAAHVAIRHGGTYAITHPPGWTATTVPALNPGATAALLSHGPTGATAAASPAPVHVLHAAREFAIPVVTGTAWQQARKTKEYRHAKAAVAELLHLVKEELRATATS